MKLGPVTKPDKRNNISSKKYGDDVVSENYEVLAIFFIYSKF